MARKRPHGGHENLERWLISYADFITLMFALFVVLFASSQSDKGKAQQVSESVRRALEDGQFASALAGILGGTASNKGKGNAMMRGPGGTEVKRGDPRFLSELLPSLQYLNKELKAEIGSGKLQVRLENRGLVISLMEAAFFRSGDDAILPAMYPSLGKIAEVLRGLPNPVRLEGHTDSIPIHNARFRSNWQLSAARSLAMLELLTGRFALPPGRLAIAGYADNVPAASNGSEEGRARNRRVDLVILNQSGYENEPKPASGTAAAPQGH